MKIHYSFDDIGVIKNPVVTTGTFDGVHIGHDIIISRLNELAAGIDGESALITFHPHPRKVLFPDKASELKLINTQNEKKLMLAKTGLDHLFIINFTLEFSKTSSHDFVNKILLDKLNAKIIVVGFNHHFGHNREGDYDYLYELSKERNFQVLEIPQQDIENEAVSSTRIRKSIADCNIMRANAYLNHQYFIMGKLDNIIKTDNETVYQIELEEKEKLIPPNGRYATKIMQDNITNICFAEVNNSEILIFIDNMIEIDTQNNAILYFYKKFRLLDFDNNETNFKRKEDRELLHELIF